jgi:hypothetical protein
MQSMGLTDLPYFRPASDVDNPAEPVILHVTWHGYVGARTTAHFVSAEVNLNTMHWVQSDIRHEPHFGTSLISAWNLNYA